jgi:hypothetical protein
MAEETFLFQIVAAVRLATPAGITRTGDQAVGTATGYFQKFGVAAPNSELAKRLVEAQVRDGALDWAGSKITRMSFEEAGSLLGDLNVLQTRIRNARGVTIWYQSGRAFY